LRKTYAEVAGLLRPGGLLLNGDHFVVDQPRLALLDRGLMEAQRRRMVDGNGSADGGRGENWPQWWAAVAADPVLADLNAERKHRWAMAANHGSEGGRLATHLGALSEAGFTEIGTLWQHGENRLLCAFKP
jgi:hypothetical protein